MLRSRPNSRPKPTLESACLVAEGFPIKNLDDLSFAMANDAAQPAQPSIRGLKKEDLKAAGVARSGGSKGRTSSSDYTQVIKSVRSSMHRWMKDSESGPSKGWLHPYTTPKGLRVLSLSSGLLNACVIDRTLDRFASGFYAGLKPDIQ
jgi:hypothetical protein